jgi:Uma2 family endonuclease
MVQRLWGDEYGFNPADPRAPSQATWDRMTLEERTRALELLPAEVPWELMPPEGDPHFKAKASARKTLDDFFHSIGRKIYISGELSVYYPDEPRFAPDLFAVLDVESYDRTKWVVSHEGKGLDWVLEVYFSGDASKDFELNVERYARLGIPEYFIFDRAALSLRGYRLPPTEQGRPPSCVYRPIVLQQGQLASQVLGLDLAVEGTNLRFLYGTAPIADADERIAKLGTELNRVIKHKVDAEQRAAELAQQLSDRDRQLSDRDRQLAQAQAELERLRRGH